MASHSDAGTTDHEDPPHQSGCSMYKTDHGADALKKAKVIFVLGGPGCGKGTHCDMLCERIGFVHLSSGDLLRAEVKGGSERGKELQAMMDKGQLVPSDVIEKLLKDEMLKHVTTTKGFLLDGYPRAIDQARTFERDIAPVNRVVWINVPDEVMTERMLERAKTSGRSDDNIETLNKRIATYHAETKPVVDYYRQFNKVHEVVATADTKEENQAKFREGAGY